MAETLHIILSFVKYSKSPAIVYSTAITGVLHMAILWQSLFRMRPSRPIVKISLSLLRSFNPMGNSWRGQLIS
jgi:hypothetical protein